MKILITGIPGTGKSFLSNKLKEKYKYYNFIIINDKEFSKKYKLGKYNKKEKIYEVSIPLLNKKLNVFLKTSKNIILEGHLFSEISKKNLLIFDKIIIFECLENIVRKRLKDRNYNLVKIEENIMCLNIKYIQNNLDSKNVNYTELLLTENSNTNFNKLSKSIGL
jgi:broad-specificity NMP kinase